MKREIKFRGKIKAKDFRVKLAMEGKQKNEGEWAYGDIHLQSIIPHIHEGMDKYPIDVDTVGQFTGLLDKNGKEIYEGDIMGLPELDAKGVAYKNRYVRVVEWVNDGFFLLDYCVMGDEVRKYGDRLALEISLNSNYAGIARCFKQRGLDYTVIGNIHDNPELLKTEIL